MPKGAFQTFALGVLLCTGLESNAQQGEPTEGIRAQLESEFRATTGLGFKGFECRYPHGWPGSREILCDAVDEEDDEFLYRLIIAAGEDAPRTTMKQSVEQLNPEGLAMLARPGYEFLEGFDKEEWGAVFASLSPELQAQLGPDGLPGILEPVKAQFGAFTSEPQAAFYATPGEGLHQLDYAFATAHGDAIGRFRLVVGAEENPRIVAFLLTAEPGSPLQARLLEGMGMTVLAQFFDQPITAITGPLASLKYLGDTTEAVVVMADGSTVRARVEQHGSSYDMDSNDYRFQILDSETLVRLHYSAQEQSATAVNCPKDVVPDGQSLECEVTLPDGSKARVSLMRRGGDHRMIVLE